MASAWLSAFGWFYEVYSHLSDCCCGCFISYTTLKWTALFVRFIYFFSKQFSRHNYLKSWLQPDCKAQLLLLVAGHTLHHAISSRLTRFFQFSFPNLSEERECFVVQMGDPKNEIVQETTSVYLSFASLCRTVGLPARTRLKRPRRWMKILQNPGTRWLVLLFPIWTLKEVHRRVDEEIKIIQVSKGQIPYQLVWFQILVSLFPVPCFNVDVTENNLFREYISGHRSLLLSFPLIKLRDWSDLCCCGTYFRATGLNSRFSHEWVWW